MFIVFAPEAFAIQNCYTTIGVFEYRDLRLTENGPLTSVLVSSGEECLGTADIIRPALLVGDHGSSPSMLSWLSWRLNAPAGSKQ